MCGLWVRNGLQIKGQALTYVQCHFCKSMVDADLFLLQVCATQLRTSNYLSTVLDRFQIKDWLFLSEFSRTPNPRVYRDQDQELQMVESCLVFLVSVLSLRVNLGLDEETLARLEMVSLLCLGDKTHSMLYEHMPEKCGTSVPLALFDKVLGEVAQYSEPRFEASGNMQEGMYLPKGHVWEELYDPVFVMLRAVHRRDFQTSIERFTSFAKTKYENDSFRSKTVTSPWPPWRLPPPVDEGFEDPRKILHSKYAHGLIFNLLHKAVHGKKINDFVTSLAVHLLELAVTFPHREGFSGKEVALSNKPWFMSSKPVDLQYDTWYPTDWLSANLRHMITVIFANNHEDWNLERAQPGANRQNSVYDEEDDDQRAMSRGDGSNALTQVQSMEVDQVQDGAMVRSLDLDTIWRTISANGGASQGLANAPGDQEGLRLALTGPGYHGTTEIVPQTALANEERSSSSSPMQEFAQGFPELGQTVNPAITHGAHHRQAPNAAGPSSTSNFPKSGVTIVNESIITLLLKLHSEYSGKPDSFAPCEKRTGPSTTKEYRESRVGDACFFVEKVLDRIHEMDPACAEDIEASRKRVWPDQHKKEAIVEEEAEKKETELKKKKAKERQRKLMEQMAAQRKKFEENTTIFDDESMSEGLNDSQAGEDGANGGHGASSSDPNGGGANAEARRDMKQYHCCHCRLESPASEDRPIGLVTLIQSTSVLAHKHRETNQLLLPTSEDMVESLPPPGEDSLGTEYEERYHMMLQHFDTQSVLLSMNRGWKGGIHVQSCGHHMHYDCRQSYCETLKQQMRLTRDQALDTDHGEFICPLCRQMANCLMPVPPDPPDLPATAFSSDPAEQRTEIASKIHQLLSEEMVHLKPGATQLRAEMSRVMEFLTRTTLPPYRMDKTNHPTQAITNFISSIARTNLESDLVQRGGSFVEIQSLGAAQASPASHINKPKFSFVPLLHVLGIHINAWPSRSLAQEWGQITGQWKMPHGFSHNHPIIPKQKDVPLLLQDPLTLMIHFILLLPSNLDKAYFNTIIKACFNLNVVQILVRLTCGLSVKERENLKLAYNENPHGDTLNSNLGHVITLMDSQGLYVSEPEAMAVGEDILGLELSDLEESAQELALPYLRIASLVQHYVYEEDLPEVYLESREFTQLLEYLNLAACPIPPPSEGCSAMEEDVPRDTLSICDGINWFHPKTPAPGDGDQLATNNELSLWCQNFYPLVRENCTAAKKLLQVNLLWEQPTLLKVPKNYDEIFQFYLKRRCTTCMKVPKDPTVCLMCGTVVCLREQCCKRLVGESNLCETVRHSWDCGGGTGIFLAVNSSTILVVRGKRACIWGSIYLDMFGEEDKELKRGKPLFLHQERLRLLEHQWKTHRFDHTHRKWVMHRGTI
eukprot:maker-scaffold889_size84747-snap-gene-0.19 protein:Tk06031 transcript:maker-scaffold889_size84747-snap-gene-0.19-mRNA-1 annotation:"e3 ubiquitin-protein ligase ubr3"